MSGPPATMKAFRAQVAALPMSAPMTPLPGISMGRDRDTTEMKARRALLAKARAGHEDSLAALRDSWGMQTLVLGGKRLIWKGVLVGAKR